jgi:hypothetical protein
LDINHPETTYLEEQGCEDLWLFFKDKGVLVQNVWEMLMYRKAKPMLA